MTNEALDSAALVPNRVVRAAIQELLLLLPQQRPGLLGERGGAGAGTASMVGAGH